MYKPYLAKLFIFAFLSFACDEESSGQEESSDGWYEASDGDGDEEEYWLDENIDDGPVMVSLLNENTALVNLILKEPLPWIAGEDNTAQRLLGYAFQLIVKNVDTSVSVSLTMGKIVESSPHGPGQYSVKVGADRRSVTVLFWNEIDGHSLTKGGHYKAMFVISKNDYLPPQNFSREIVVE